MRMRASSVLCPKRERWTSRKLQCTGSELNFAMQLADVVFIFVWRFSFVVMTWWWPHVCPSFLFAACTYHSHTFRTYNTYILWIQFSFWRNHSNREQIMMMFHFAPSKHVKHCVQYTNIWSLNNLWTTTKTLNNVWQNAEADAYTLGINLYERINFASNKNE